MFSLKMHHSKVGIIYILRQRQRPFRVFTSTIASPYAVVSSQRLIVSSALLETRVNVRGSKLLSHSGPSFCTSRILERALECRELLLVYSNVRWSAESLHFSAFHLYMWRGMYYINHAL